MFWPSVKYLSSSTVHNNTVTLKNHKCLHVQWFHIKHSVVTVVNKLQMSLWELYVLQNLCYNSIYIRTPLLTKTSVNLFSKHPQICFICIYGSLVTYTNLTHNKTKKGVSKAHKLTCTYISQHRFFFSLLLWIKVPYSVYRRYLAINNNNKNDVCLKLDFF